MPLDTAKRIMWRLQEDLEGRKRILTWELRRAIMKEAGLDRRTIQKYIKTLTELGWISRKSRYVWHIESMGEYGGLL